MHTCASAWNSARPDSVCPVRAVHGAGGPVDRSRRCTKEGPISFPPSPRERARTIHTARYDRLIDERGSASRSLLALQMSGRETRIWYRGKERNEEE